MKWFSQLSLKSRILSVVILSCFLCASVAIQSFLYFNAKELEAGIVNKQKTIHTQLNAATQFVGKQGGLQTVVEKYQKKYRSPDQLTNAEREEILNQVPIYASLLIGQQNTHVDQYEFRVFSDAPRNKDYLATTQELEVFRQFERSPDLNEIIKNEDGIITTYRPVRLSEDHGCMTCHGSPSQSPWGNGRDILGYKMEDWKDGKLHGVFAVSQNIDLVAKASTQGQIITPRGWLILGILLGALASVLISAYILKTPIHSLSRAANAITQASDQVSVTSQRMANSSQQLAQATTQQAASLEETAASIEELNSMVSKNTDNAVNTAQSSNQSKKIAENGKHIMQQMISSMSQINQSNGKIMDQVNHSNQQMVQIVEVIKEIGNKTKVINDIVFQTKLLSFNASVEAARAGEHGKGFAVVAQEVGNLAQMSGQASQEISELLENSISKVEDIVKETKTQVESLIKDGVEKIENGTQIARECNEVFEEIVENVSNVSHMATEISNASQEQSQGINELTRAMNQLDQVTQQNAATSEESSFAAKDLSKQAHSLNEVVEDLIRTIQGGLIAQGKDGFAHDGGDTTKDGGTKSSNRAA
ncbi:methyl-accepting chemotaxis protein [Pseudobdellovibrio exovorus]|uniref:Methyl-accepting transducer domain-containing protein n=1 Tax=Pseudobdellovibrio exovorus JSS TaxID=1184267 RepID=M4VQI5_9BACT|nr:methyl-accepting chemotaxis protein [Pseudobdellovibrio exovorus]AGH95419.1 hypothetical protein A11Q_1203 [Pseudobdellovibrio exovorus JSS]